MGGTRATFVVRVPRKRLIFGASIQPQNRYLHLVAGLKLCLMSMSALFRRSPGHRAELRSWRSISLQTTINKDIFLQVLVDESIFSSIGRVEGICSGAAPLIMLGTIVWYVCRTGTSCGQFWGDYAGIMSDRSSRLSVELSTTDSNRSYFSS
jgi:hypothetical protein